MNGSVDRTTNCLSYLSQRKSSQIDQIMGTLQFLWCGKIFLDPVTTTPSDANREASFAVAELVTFNFIGRGDVNAQFKFRDAFRALHGILFTQSRKFVTPATRGSRKQHLLHHRDDRHHTLTHCCVHDPTGTAKPPHFDHDGGSGILDNKTRTKRTKYCF